MAFNPFHAFRKYRKSMFAILAIICMFTFVLSSGLGGKNDILNRVQDWFNGDRGAKSQRNSGRLSDQSGGIHRSEIHIPCSPVRCSESGRSCAP